MDMSDETEKKLDPVAEVLLEELEALDPGKSLGPEQAAKIYADLRRKPNDGPQLWRRYMNAIKQQAIFLARSGRIEILRKGKPVDPNDFKGVWRMRLKRDLSEG